MSARGMTANIKAISVAAEAVGVLLSPGNRAPHLVGHHQEVATSLDHIVEIRRDKVRPSIDEHLSRVMVVARDLHAPGATMNMNVHGRLWCLCGKNVEPFDGRRAVGEALGGAKAFTYQFAVARAALDNGLQVRRIR